VQSEALAMLRQERLRLQQELKKVDRAIRALGGGRRGRPPGAKKRKRRRGGRKSARGREAAQGES